MVLNHLTDFTLLADTKFLAHRYREVTTKLLYHLREIERRKLFSELGYSSLFDYVVKELGFSEPSAARRIRAARLLEEFPEMEKKIEGGQINLSTIALASQVFSKENIQDIEIKKEVIKEIENKSLREAEKRIKEIIAPKSEPSLKKLEFLITEETFELHQKLLDLTAHRKLGQNDFLALIFKTALASLETKQTKSTSVRLTTSEDPRYITAVLRRAVFERDKVCQKCQTKRCLQVDHIKPFALGGKTDLKNLRLLCRNCNARERQNAKL